MRRARRRRRGRRSRALRAAGRRHPRDAERIAATIAVLDEAGLRGNPNLQGRVAVRFIINREGGVASAENGGSDLADSSVISCVTRAFYGLSFPQPENGIVTVTYPIVFSPAN